MAKRLAIVIGVLALLGIGFLALVPAKPGGTHCGTLIKPDYTRSQTRALVKQASDLYDEAKGLDLGGEDFAGEAVDSAKSAVAAYHQCEDARSSRRMWIYVLLGAGIVLPPAILFVAGSRRTTSGEPLDAEERPAQTGV